jgi:hypothetical protein
MNEQDLKSVALPQAGEAHAWDYSLFWLRRNPEVLASLAVLDKHLPKILDSYVQFEEKGKQGEEKRNWS